MIYLYTILIIVFGILIYLYKTSYSNFFLQSDEFLAMARKDLIAQLKRLGRSEIDILNYLVAYDFFARKENQHKYDGSTIVRDLYVIRYNEPDVRLAPDSVTHDYDYIHGANKSIFKQIASSVRYIKGLIANGHAFHWERLIGLILISPFFALFNVIKSTIKNE